MMKRMYTFTPVEICKTSFSKGRKHSQASDIGSYCKWFLFCSSTIKMPIMFLLPIIKVVFINNDFIVFLLYNILFSRILQNRERNNVNYLDIS